MEQLSFRQISDFHEFAKQNNPAIYGDMSTSDFAKTMAQNDVARDYSQGFNANFVKQGNVALDRGIEATGLPAVTGSAGRFFGDFIGYGDLGESVGKGIPRGFAQAAAVAALGAAAIGSAPITLGAAALGMLGLAASYAQGYTDTGSQLGGVVNAGLNLAAPGLDKFGAGAARKLVGTNAGNVFNNTFGRLAAEEVGAQTAQFGADAVGQVVQGQNPFTAENIIANVGGNVATFASLNAAGLVNRGVPSFVNRLRSDPNTKISPYQAEVIQHDFANLSDDAFAAFTSAQDELARNIGARPTTPDYMASDTVLAQQAKSSNYRKTIVDLRLDPNSTLNLVALDTARQLAGDLDYQELKKSYAGETAPKDTFAYTSKDKAFYGQDPEKRSGVITTKVPIFEGVPASVENAVHYIDVQDGNLRSALVQLFSSAEKAKVLKPRESIKPIDFTDDMNKGLSDGFNADALEAQKANMQYEEAYAQLKPTLEQVNAEVQMKKVQTVDDAFDLPKVINASVDLLNQLVKMPENTNPSISSMFDNVDGNYKITAASIERTLEKFILTEDSYEGAVQRMVQQMKNEYQTRLTEHLNTIETERLSASKKTKKKTVEYKVQDFAEAESAAITAAYDLVSNKGDFAQRALDRVLESYMEAKSAGKNPKPEMITKNLSKLLGSEKVAEAKTKSRRREISTETSLGENMTIGDTVANRSEEATSGTSKKAASVQGSLDEIVKAPDFEKRVARVTELRRKTDVTNAVAQMRAVYELVQEGVIVPGKTKSSMSPEQLARFSEKLQASGFNSDVKSAGPLIKRSLDRLRLVLEDAGVRGLGEIPLGDSPEKVKNLPAWAREEMVRQGINPSRKFNDADLENKSIQEALSFESAESLAKEGIVKENGRFIYKRNKKQFSEIVAELNARNNPQAQLASDVNVFFNKFLDTLGFEPALKEQYLQTAQRVATAFGNLHETRLVELQKSIGRDGLTGEVLQTMGLFVPLGPKFAGTTQTARNLVALVGNKMASKQLEPFLKISALGHELFHALANNVKLQGIDVKRLETLERMNAFANDLTEVQRRQIAQSVADIMIPKKVFGQNADVLNPMLDYVAKSGEEFTAYYAQMLSVGLASRTKPERRGFIQKLKQFFTFSSQFESDFGQGFYRNLSEMTEALDAGLKNAEFKPEQVAALQSFQKDLKSLMQTPDQMRRAAEFLSSVNQTYDPQVSMERITADELRNAQALKIGTKAKEAYDKFLADPSRVFSKGKKLGIVQNKLGNPFQAALEVASFIPAARDFIATVYDTQSKVNLFRQTQMLDFMVRDVAGQWTTIQATGGKKLTPEQQRTFNAVDLVETSPAANKAFSDVARFHNEEGQAGRGKLFTMEELNKVPSFAKLSSQQKSDVFHLVDLTRKANATSANLILDNTNFILGTNVARIVQYRNAGLNWEQAHQAGQMIRMAAQDAAAQGLKGPEAEVFITQRVAPQTAGADISAAVKQAVRQSPIIAEIATHLTSREWYFNEQRVGDYLITYQSKSGEKGTIGASDRTDVRTKMAQLIKDGHDQSTFQVIKKADLRNNDRVQLGEETLALFQKLEQAAYNEALKNVGPEAAELLKAEYNPGDVSLAQLQKQQAKDYEKTRTLAPGREYLNIWESSVNYYNKLSHSLANQRMKAATEVMLNDPKFKENPEIQKRFNEYRDAVLAPIARAPQIENAVFTYFLGFNVSSAMVNLGQNVMVLPSQLISNGANVVQAHSLVKNAAGMIAKAYTQKGLARGEIRFEDAELNKHFQTAVSEGFLRNGAFTDLLNNEELLAVNTKRLRDGKKGMTAAELLGNASHVFFKSSKWLFSATESANMQIGFIAGWQLGKQKGLSGDKLYAFAKEQSRAANFSGGKYNRPMGFYKLGNMQGVGSAVLALQNFTIANYSMMSRLFKDSIGTTGLEPHQRKQSMKAFATMLGAQALGAGVLGLPLVGALAKIVEDVFGTEVVAPFYEGLAGLAGDDQELGGTIADIATNGFASHMMGVDVGSRLGMGNMGPLNTYNGFDMNGLLGATGGLVKNIYDGVKQISQEGLTLTNPIIPSAFKKPLELYANKGNFHDRNGNLLMEPNQAEQIAYFMGFNPKNLSDLKFRDRLMKQADLVSKANRKKEYEDYATLLLEGNPIAVKQALQERQQQDSTFDIESAYRGVVDAAVQRTLPESQLDKPSGESAGRQQQIANAFALKTPRALESARAQLKIALMSTLSGRPVTQSNREVLKIQLVDQLIQQNPTMPRSLALRLVDKQLNQN